METNSQLIQTNSEDRSDRNNQDFYVNHAYGERPFSKIIHGFHKKGYRRYQRRNERCLLRRKVLSFYHRDY